MIKKPVKKKCSELVIDFLVEKKITHIFDLAGGMITYLEDANQLIDNQFRTAKHDKKEILHEINIIKKNLDNLTNNKYD